MKNIVSETIFSNGDLIIPMADVQHIEKLQQGGIWVITKHTKYNFENDIWENPIFIPDVDDKDKKFIKAYCQFRHELDM